MKNNQINKYLLIISLMLFLVQNMPKYIVPVSGGKGVIDENSLEIENLTLRLSENLELSITSQPRNNIGYISDEMGVVTSFSQAARLGSIGLIAHNYLSGEKFFDLEPGDIITLSDKDSESLQQYRVVEMQQFQALQPTSIHSKFRNLDTDEITSAHDLARSVYEREGHLILQTCIENEGNLEWGRLFVITEPMI